LQARKPLSFISIPNPSLKLYAHAIKTATFALLPRVFCANCKTHFMGGCQRFDSSHGFRVSDGFLRIRDGAKVRNNVPSK